MLIKGWKRLLEDLIGREGPFLETECVPFAGLAIILWPLAVVSAVIASVICSIFLGLYSGVVVHQVFINLFIFSHCFPIINFDSDRLSAYCSLLIFLNISYLVVGRLCQNGTCIYHLSSFSF